MGGWRPGAENGGVLGGVKPFVFVRSFLGVVVSFTGGCRRVGVGGVDGSAVGLALSAVNTVIQ